MRGVSCNEKIHAKTISQVERLGRSASLSSVLVVCRGPRDLGLPRLSREPHFTWTIVPGKAVGSRPSRCWSGAGVCVKR
jgi:hypothetical protein